MNDTFPLCLQLNKSFILYSAKETPSIDAQARDYFTRLEAGKDCSSTLLWEVKS